MSEILKRKHPSKVDTFPVEIDCDHGGGMSQANIEVATIEAVDLGGA